MARKFQKIEDWEQWIPDLDGERTLYADSPEEAVSMELRFLTKEQRDHFQRMAARYEKSGAKNSGAERAMRQMFDDNVRNVQNYWDGDLEVKTGGELYDVDGDQPMILAVTQALFDRSTLDAGLAKKLRSGCASTSLPPTNNDNGGAAVVTPAFPETTLEVLAKPPISESQTG